MANMSKRRAVYATPALAMLLAAVVILSTGGGGEKSASVQPNNPVSVSLAAENAKITPGAKKKSPANPTGAYLKTSETQATVDSSIELLHPRQEEVDPLIFENSDYSSYEESVLQELADVGDVTAMLVLAMRYVTSERSNESLERAELLLQEAAVYGDNSYAFSTMVEEKSFELKLALQGRLEMPADAQRAALVDTLAYAQVAAMRGNPSINAAVSERIVTEYDVQISDSDRADALIKAYAMYDLLEAKRQEYGLGPFPEKPVGIDFGTLQTSSGYAKNRNAQIHP